MKDRAPGNYSLPNNDKTGTDEKASSGSRPFSIEVPSVTLPKGGGSIKGIDEKFSVNAVNGTSALSIPIPVSSIRDFLPSLSINYNSGSGNGIFGMGWSLSLASIKRKTEKELPQYFDYDDSDTYIFSGSEDLVPQFQKDLAGNWLKDLKGAFIKNEADSADGNFRVRQYRPRIEGSFARIERWTAKATGIIFWKTISGSNVTSVYGQSASSCIADPSGPTRIFEWFLEYTFDDKGNFCLYQYAPEDLAAMPNELHNQNRKNGNAPFANTYLSRVLCGNKIPYQKFGDPIPLPGQFVFETVFDYGQYDGLKLPFTALTGPWNYRPDAFSNYRSGFEIRTCRLCSRVLLYHHFDELPGGSALVKSLDFAYGNNGMDGFTFLLTAMITGYTKNDDSSYGTSPIPPTSFAYQEYAWNQAVNTTTATDLENAPDGIDNDQYSLVDLFGEGLSGILSEQENAWYYKSNLGGGHFTPAANAMTKPSVMGLNHQFQLTDLNSNGLKQIVSWQPEPKGFFELDDDNNWQGFRPFTAVPTIDFHDSNIRQLDLNGDGMQDLLITGDLDFRWYPSAGKEGYRPQRQVYRKSDEEKGPAIVFNDKEQRIFLADMSGDGLSDIVRIRNADICYWPNLGYGRFGAKVSMENSPLFDRPEMFNPALIRLADIDGSGTSDIIYLGQSQFSIWLNQQGNGFFPQPKTIDPFSKISNAAKITVADLLGTGLSCLIWSSPLPADQRQPLKYIDLMNSQKPHILISYSNNLGKDIFLEYTPSTKFYLADKLAGAPWVTKLHFPVWCVSKATSFDRIRKTRFASEYSYHHGYYDHAEREFRGFGRVDQTDAETIDSYILQAAAAGIAVQEKKLNQPPVLTRSWFHTGAFLNNEKILDQFAGEYFQNPTVPENKLPEPAIPQGLSGIEYREALRACKSFLLRKEIYALDDTLESKLPYLTQQHNCLVKSLQPKGQNKYAVFLTHESESILYHYERNPADPRVMHSFVLDIDPYANVLSATEVVYPRRPNPAAETAQLQMYITHVSNSFTNDILGAVNYRMPQPHTTVKYELTGLAAPATYFSIEDIKTALGKAATLDYEETPSGALEKRILEINRTNYIGDNTVTILPFGTIESKGLVQEHFKAVFNDGLLDVLFKGKLKAPELSEVKKILLTAAPLNLTEPQGAYVQANISIDSAAGPIIRNYYWIRSGFAAFDKSQFFLPVSYTDILGHMTTVKYETKYHLGIKTITDPKNNMTTVDRFNYRTVAPFIITDINGNRSAVRYDGLGMVIRTFLMGKAGNNEGDFLDETSVEIKGAGDEPTTEMEYSVTNWYTQSLGISLVNLNNFNYRPKPDFVKTTLYETHFNPSRLPRVLVQVSYTYSDGSGQEIMKKMPAEPGAVFSTGPDGRIMRNPGGSPLVITDNPRWIGTGRTILNNKGKPVKQYQPYYSGKFEFEDEQELVETGASPILYYDPLGRMIRTEYPDGTFSKVEFDGWAQTNFDQNDTVLTNETDALGNPLPPTHWYQEHVSVPGSVDNDVAQKTAVHNNTPSVTLFDALGRTFKGVADNGGFGKYSIRTQFDIQGKPLIITDAMGNPVMQYLYDMTGKVIYQDSMDSGRRWLIHRTDDKPLLSWDEKDHRFGFVYDELNRPLLAKVSLAGAPATVYDKIVYGEDPGAPPNSNLSGKIWQHFDTAALVVNLLYDFKGNLLSSTQQLLQKFDYNDTAPLDWSVNPVLDPGTYTLATTFDALNRPVDVTRTADLPNITNYTYNKSGLIKQIQVSVRGSVFNKYITNIEYDPKGQRTLILYGNNIRTTYEYDPLTFRLDRIHTTRKTKNAAGNIIIESLQDLNYTYDPVGNITFLTDKALQTIFFRNKIIEPSNDYTYDPVYRLIKAKGREHIGQQKAPGASDADRMNNAQLGDGKQLQTYIQQFTYDAVGNMMLMSNQGSWSRSFTYNNTGAVKSNNNNRLITAPPNDAVGTPFTYTYDAHGNMRKMPHLPVMAWDFKDRLIKSSQQVVASGGTGESTHYVYDGTGQRVRKVTLRQGTGLKKNELIYQGDLELFILYDGDGVTPRLKRETLHVNDDKQRIALVETKTLGAAVMDGTMVGNAMVRYQHGNHLGSACLEISGDPAKPEIISYEEYYPFGSTSYQARDKTINPVAKRYRYTGMERDEETGLEYHSARYYTPWLARWTAPDPLGIKDQLNIYSYARNNPIGRNDIDGKESKTTDDSHWYTVPLIITLLPLVLATVVFTTLTGGEDKVHAPQKTEDISRASNRISTPERAGRIGLLLATTGATGYVVKAGGGIVLQGLIGGGSYGVGSQGIDDITKKKYSGGEAYALAGFNGAAFAILTLGTFRLASRVFTPGPYRVQVTSWADKGIKPDLTSGRWVQLGGPTPWNFLKTGLPGPKADNLLLKNFAWSKVPFTNSITAKVPASSLKLPPGLWRGLLGQRILK